MLISASAVSQWGSGEQRPEKNPNQSPAFINCCPTGRSGVFPCRISNCRKSTKRLNTTDPYACSPRNKSSSKNVLTVRCLCYLTLCLSVCLFVSVCLSVSLSDASFVVFVHLESSSSASSSSFFFLLKFQTLLAQGTGQPSGFSWTMLRCFLPLLVTIVIVSS